MKTINFLRNATGIGLVEVMMAVAVTGGLTLTIAKLMENSSQSAKQIEAKSENTTLKGLLMDTLGNPTACVNSLYGTMNATNVASLTAGTPTAAVSIPNIKDKMNVIKYATTPVSTAFNLNPLTITSMSITNYNNGAGTGDLVVQSTFQKSASQVVMVKPIRIPMNFAYTGADLTACSTMAVGGGEWLLGGNAGTNPASDYIGTSDDVSLNFKINAQPAGRIERPTSNTSLGYWASKSNTTGVSNTAFGHSALRDTTTGSLNSAFGDYSLQFNTTTGSNSAFGSYALSYATGRDNAGFGAQALKNASGSYNSAFGSTAMMNTSSGFSNTAMGYMALFSNTTGAYNVAIGANALKTAGTMSENVAIGPMALENVVSNSNLAIGHFTLKNATTGARNFGMGAYALMNTTTNSNNMGLGYMSLMSNTTGQNNMGLGSMTGWQNPTGSQNISIGMDSLSYMTSGSNNLAIGYRAGYNITAGDGNVFIGHYSGQGVTTATNKLHINNGVTATSLIEGDFTSVGRYVQINGSLKLNPTSWGVAASIPPNSAIRSANTSASDKIYIDTRTLFRDGASGGSGFVGIAGGLGIGSGSWWDGSVIPPQGSVIIEGNVGIGTQSPAYKLDVNGLIRSTGALVVSDIRLKENLKPVKHSLERLSKLNAYNYDWKDKEKFGDQKQLGLVAQEVQKVFPEAIQKDKNGILAVSYSNLVAPVIEAIKELYGKFLMLVKSDEKQNLEIKNLKAENEKLMLQMKKQQDSFEARMKKLEADVAKQKAQKK